MFFRNCLRIYFSDMKKITRNWVAGIIALGIALLPSLYAWVNIRACWDPYSNTKSIKVGIVNLDEGAQIQDISINVGAELASGLKENKKLGWTFYSTRDEGIERVKSGDVYATIIVPKDFSQKLGTLLDETPIKPQLEYYVNEKINAIAPKMTDSGANTIQKTITESFIQTVAEKVFDALNPLGYSIDKNYDKILKFESFLNLVDDDLPDVVKHVNNLLDKADQNGNIALDNGDKDVKFLRRVLGNTIKYTNVVGEDSKELSEKTASSSAEIRSCLSDAEDLMGQVSVTLGNLEDSYNSGIPDISSGISNISASLDSVVNMLNGIKSMTNNLKGILTDADLEKIKSQIVSMQNDLAGLKDGLSDLSNLKDVLYDTGDSVSKLNSTVSNFYDNLKSLSDDVDEMLNSTESVLNELAAFASSIDNNSVNSDAITSINSLLTELQKNPTLFKNIITILTRIKTELESSSDTSLDALKLSTAIENLSTRLSVKEEQTSEKFDTALGYVYDLKSNLKDLEDSLDDSGAGLQKTLRSLRASLTDITDMLGGANDIIGRTGNLKLNDFSGELDTITNSLKNLSSSLNTLSKNLENSDSSSDVKDVLESGSKLASSTQKLLRKAKNDLDGSLVSNLQSFLTGVNDASGNISSLLGDQADNLDDLDSFLTKLNGNNINASDLKKFRDDFSKYAGDFSEIATSIRTLSNLIDIKDIAKKMQQDSNIEGDFFSSPIELNTTKLFPVKNYGAGLTPFYTTLCLWVGSLLLTAMFSTHALNADFLYTPNEEFIGKYMLFATVALFQGLIASAGDMILLKVNVVHPILFVLLAILYSLVFSGITYTLTALMDNVGKAIGVVLLVFQLAGSGGTFPIECTPAFFQNIYKLLPFTYAINGMREALAGINYPALLIDITVIIFIGILFIAVGLICKRYANKALKRFAGALHDSKIIGH
ncbi:MAG: YhgE/Pip domain-containing protein [Bacillota bacterium]|nr:YhgE/Pip domain-containing protein [Bacillota bacterium]